MSKITINELSFYYEDYFHSIFERVNLIMDTDWRLGLIGRNGRGKTTLLRLLTEEIKPSSGRITVPVNMEYFPYTYQAAVNYHITIDIIKENIGGFKTMEVQMEEIIQKNDTSGFTEYAVIQEKYAQLGGYEIESRIYRECNDMGLDMELLYRPYETLSGGEKIRMMILILFLRRNSFVLLDEPTNHLDLKGKEMVASYLEKKKGFIVVSHDRDFLDRVIDHVLSINKCSISIEQGNYSTWKINKEAMENFEFAAKRKLEHQVKVLEKRAEGSRKWAQEAGTQKYAFASHARANGEKSYMRQAKRSENQVTQNLEEKKQLLKNYEEAKELTLRQKEPEGEGWIVRIKKMDFSYEYTEKQLFRNFSLAIYPGERIWLRGENGVGKSTLMQILAGNISCPEIEYAEDVKIVLSGQDPLWKEGNIKERFTRRPPKAFSDFAQFCSCFDLPEDYLERPLETFSSGELKKIDIARVLAEENHLLLLDEPLNYMDIYFREQLEKAILLYEPALLFVEHDLWFGKQVGTRIIQLDE